MSNLVLCFSLLFVVGCSVPHPSKGEISQRVVTLKNLIVELSPKVAKDEAEDLARSSIGYSLKLAKEYDVVAPAWWQNSLVNIGIKKRGLCYEWTEDLLKYLVAKNYKTLSLHAIGANIGYFNEHNALSVSAKGEGIVNSIVLDAWRESGNLFFSKINEDDDYEWEERFNLYGVLPPRGGKK